MHSNLKTVPATNNTVFFRRPFSLYTLGIRRHSLTFGHNARLLTIPIIICRVLYSDSLTCYRAHFGRRRDRGTIYCVRMSSLRTYLCWTVYAVPSNNSSPAAKCEPESIAIASCAR